MLPNQHQPQRFRCPGCGYHSDEPALIPESQGAAACPSCGLTTEEGQHKLNDELAALFHRGMHLSGDMAAAAPSAPVISSATIAALGLGSSSGGGSTGGGGGGGGSGTIDGSPLTSRLGYTISQHYHHSTHVTTPRQRPVSSHAALGGSAGGNGGVTKDDEGDMDMDAATLTRNRDASSVHAAEPYMKSGYEFLAERDYNLQAQSGAYGAPPFPPALDPAFSSKEWWRDFSQPIEFQYGMFQQMSERQGPESDPPANEDEQMVL